MKVYINQSMSCWVLCFVDSTGQVTKSFTFNRLIHAIDAACVLKVHINNIAELPLTQYANQGE